LKIPVLARVSNFTITVYDPTRGNLLAFKGIFLTSSTTIVAATIAASVLSIKDFSRFILRLFEGSLDQGFFKIYPTAV
jgi:hypothetical protein